MATVTDRQYEAFRFKKFSLRHQVSPMKVGVDGILLGTWTRVDQARRILDIGTGCGLIALLLAQRNELANITGVEIDTATAAEALENVRCSPWPDRISIVPGSIQDFAATAGEEFDLIISNPPFFTGGTLSSNLDRTTVRHTTKLSHSDLFTVVQKMLSRDGRFAVILPHLEGRRFMEMVENYGFHVNRMGLVYPYSDGKIERLLISIARRKFEYQQERIVLRNQDGSFSDYYRSLTSEFYLD